ncbi:MAG: hypothetical protein KDD37_02480, partial [Bdellovibrionales bacterium]|nr:hypothetical protein [Bdellovibrionales bacterium]
RYLVELDSTNLARYTAVIRTLLDGSVKLFVMENEVKLTAIEDLPLNLLPALRRKRFENLDFEEDKDLIAALDNFSENTEPIDLAKVWRTICKASNAIRDHQVTGKPLKIKKATKKVA